MLNIADLGKEVLPLEISSSNLWQTLIKIIDYELRQK